MFKKLLSVFVLFFAASTSYGQWSCYKEKDLARVETYSITFEKEMELYPNKSNDNFNMRINAGRYFGCVVLSKVPKLQGKYTSDYSRRLNAVCEGKKDWAFTQFKDAQGKDVFRLQCDYPVFEDQLPQPFAPSFESFEPVKDQKTQKVILSSGAVVIEKQ